MRRCCTFLLLVALPAKAEEKDIAKLLQSAQARSAHHAAEQQAQGFQPQLEKLLADTNFRVRAAAFDALIRTKTADEAKRLKPKLTVVVSDHRKDKSTPLPKLD